MRVSEIRAAMSKGILADIEEAFMALVLYPGHATIEGVKSVNELVDLFSSVAQALHDDKRVMPASLADMIQGEVGDALESRTYAGGSRAVRMYTMRWRGFFAARFVPGNR